MISPTRRRRDETSSQNDIQREGIRITPREAAREIGTSSQNDIEREGIRITPREAAREIVDHREEKVTVEVQLSALATTRETT